MRIPKTVPLAGVMINIVHDQPDCSTSPLGTHTAKPGSDQLGSAVEVEGKSYCHPQPQPGDAPHSNEARNKPAEDHLSAEGITSDISSKLSP